VDFLHGGNEAVAAPGQCLDEAGLVVRIAEGFPQAHHRVVQSVIEVYKGIAGPQAFAKLIARDHLARLFKKDGENLKGLLGQLQAQTMLTQLERFEVDLKHAAANHFGSMGGVLHSRPSRVGV
jgi:hypothetical protein